VVPHGRAIAHRIKGTLGIREKERRNERRKKITKEGKR